MKTKLKTKKIIVTGGAGFIGSHLVDRLIDNGHQVVVIDNLISGKKDYINPKSKFYQVDICSGEVEDIFKKEKPDFVFHLAAQIDVRKSIENPASDNEINVLGGLSILENCLKFKVKKIVFSSTGGALYGDATQIPTKETYATNPISPYGIHKLTFEKYLNYYYRVYGQKYAVLRFANVYGPRQYKGGECGVIGIFTDNALSRKKSFVYGDGLQTRDYVYVDDVVEALVLASGSDYVGELNISTKKEATILDVVKLIEDITQKDFLFKYLKARKGDVKRSCLDNRKAKKELNWEPKVNLKKGMALTIDWLKEVKNK